MTRLSWRTQGVLMLTALGLLGFGCKDRSTPNAGETIETSPNEPDPAPSGSATTSQGTTAASPSGALPGDALPGDALPGDALPGDALPGDALPGGVEAPAGLPGANEVLSPALARRTCGAAALLHVAGETSREQAEVVLWQCADLFQQRPCRDAFRANVTGKDPALSSLLDACASAYCSALDAPDEQPACAAQRPVGLEAQEAWGLLQEAILRHDHGDRFEQAAAGLLAASKLLMSALGEGADPPDAN